MHITPDCVRSATRHPTYYFNDGSIILLLEQDNILYRVFSTVLTRASGCFSTMLSLKAEDPAEGKDDLSPIILSQVSSRDFDYLMAYLIDHDFPQSNEEGLVALLNLTTFYEMERHQERVKAAIVRLPSFRPALQYYLGIKNSIPEWIERSFRDLVTLPIEQLTWPDIERIGLEAFTTLVRTKAEVESQRKLIAFWPPTPRYSSSCSTNMRCNANWERGWWASIAKHLLHPDDGLSGKELARVLGKVEIQGMCDGCLALTLDWVKESGVLTNEDTIVADVIRNMLP